MDSWKKAIFIACVYGFFKELCPLVPFLTSYLTDQCGVTKADIIKQVSILVLSQFMCRESAYL